MPTLTKWAIEKDKAVAEGVGQGTPTAMAFLIYLDVEDKKSFILYADLMHTLEKLPDAECGQLFKHILRYVNDRNPETDNILVEIAFEPIKQQLKRDLCKWEDKSKDRKESGIKGNLKRWNPDLYDLVESGKMDIDEAVNIAKDRKASQPDKKVSHPIANVAVNVNDSVSVNDNDNVINNKGFDLFWDQYHEITSMPKTDKEPALKHWKKLTDTERNLAIEKITDYYHSVENKKYVKKARTYLADKSFNDEHVNAEKKEEQYPDAVKMLAALGGYGPSIYPAIVKRLHEVQYKSEYGFDGILKVAVMAVENFGERGVNAYTWKAIESIDDPELRRDFRNRVKSHGYEAIHQRMVKKYLNEN
jgi:hypothetical protein